MNTELTVEERKQRCRQCTCHKRVYTDNTVRYAGLCCEWCRVRLTLVPGADYDGMTVEEYQR